jgi:hypothetical protein
MGLTLNYHHYNLHSEENLTRLSNSINIIKGWYQQLPNIFSSDSNERLEAQKNATDDFMSSHLSLLDPKIVENAKKILNLSDEEAKDVAVVERKYNRLSQDLEERKVNLAKISIFFSQSIEAMLDNIRKARDTLTNHLSTDCKHLN